MHTKTQMHFKTEDVPLKTSQNTHIYSTCKHTHMHTKNNTQMHFKKEDVDVAYLSKNFSENFSLSLKFESLDKGSHSPSLFQMISSKSINSARRDGSGSPHSPHSEHVHEGAQHTDSLNIKQPASMSSMHASQTTPQSTLVRSEATQQSMMVPMPLVGREPGTLEALVVNSQSHQTSDHVIDIEVTAQQTCSKDTHGGDNTDVALKHTCMETGTSCTHAHKDTHGNDDTDVAVPNSDGDNLNVIQEVVKSRQILDSDSESHKEAFPPGSLADLLGGKQNSARKLELPPQQPPQQDFVLSDVASVGRDTAVAVGSDVAAKQSMISSNEYVADTHGMRSAQCGRTWSDGELHECATNMTGSHHDDAGRISRGALASSVAVLRATWNDGELQECASNMTGSHAHGHDDVGCISKGGLASSVAVLRATSGAGHDSECASNNADHAGIESDMNANMRREREMGSSYKIQEINEKELSRKRSNMSLGAFLVCMCVCMYT
jgi:hypothetical protein